MAGRKPKQAENAEYERLKAASGWYLRAWRHYRNLSLDDLAAEVGTSKSVISELESGKTRYNRDNVDAFCRALGTKDGFLIGTNPFTVHPDRAAMMDAYEALDPNAQEAVKGLIKSLGGHRA